MTIMQLPACSRFASVLDGSRTSAFWRCFPGFVLLVVSLVLAPPVLLGQDLVGFTSEGSSAQVALEQRADLEIDPAEIVDWNKVLTPRPHNIGSPQARANAEWLRDRFVEWGFATEIETYHVLMPFPTVRELSLVGVRSYRPKLQEDVLAGDATSKIAVETGLPPFNAYSADGDVEAELVYVNQGIPRDYEELERLGIDVRGKVVIARYGGSWRGIKPKLAAEKGAVGCLIYNDPLDDGFTQGEVYPKGAYKPPGGVQRGSVLDLPKRPGDPLTPGYGARLEVDRLDRAKADTIMTIPVMPLAWRDAQPLLEALQGRVAPAAWRGALPLTYHIGPGPARVHLRLQFDWSLRPVYNVIAKMSGSQWPDQWVMRGNHHDAWVIGGRDPISGLVGLLAEAKAVGALARTGWRPRRTLVYAAWDGEEPGLLGSTEWAEDHGDELREKLIVYTNSDSNGRGFLGVGGSHALEVLVNEVATAVSDPQTGVSVAQRLRASLEVAGGADEADRLLGNGPLRIEALGSGSDFSAFLQHLGIPSLNVGFGGESDGGEYHTTFDSHDFFRRFVDPGGQYGAALAKVGARLTLRLAQADVLPFDFRDTARTISGYVDEVMTLAGSQRKDLERRNRLVREGVFVLAADPTETFVAPSIVEPAPYFDWSELLAARDHLTAAAATAQQRTAAAVGSSASSLVALNKALFTAEQLLLDDSLGLPRRPWFRHQIYAPGYYTGYGVKTLPGIREALEELDWSSAQEHIRRVAARVEALAARLSALP